MPPTIEQVIAAIPDWAGRTVTAERDRGRADQHELTGSRSTARRTSSASPARRPSLLAVDRGERAPQHPRRRGGRASGRGSSTRCPTCDVFVLDWLDGADDVERAFGGAGHAGADRRGAPPAPCRARASATTSTCSASPSATSRSSSSGRSAIPAGYRERLAQVAADRGRAPARTAADRAVPQRPAGRELPRRRRAAVARRLGVQRQQRPDLRARQHRPGARLRRCARPELCAAYFGERLPCPPRPDAPPDDHVRRRLDPVGRHPGRGSPRSTTTSAAGPRSAGPAPPRCSTGPTSRGG